MITEVFTAANFITDLIRSSGFLNEDQLHLFKIYLQEALHEHYKDCWFPKAPHRGSAYRCLNVTYELDPLIGKAGFAIGITEEQLLSLLPSELTVWVDPNKVSYRMGEDESIWTLYRS